MAKWNHLLNDQLDMTKWNYLLEGDEAFKRIQREYQQNPTELNLEKLEKARRRYGMLSWWPAHDDCRRPGFICRDAHGYPIARTSGCDCAPYMIDDAYTVSDLPEPFPRFTPRDQIDRCRRCGN